MVYIIQHITKIGSRILLLLLLWGMAGKVYAQTKNYTYQALFLYKFTQHITWPKDATYGNKFRIGILGDKYVFRLMNNFLAQKKIDGVETEVVHFTNVKQVKPCHSLFVSESNNLSLTIVFGRLKDVHCLVVSEKKDLFTKPALFPILSKQSNINLKIVNKKLRFDLNKPAIHARGLRLDSDPAKPSLQTLAKYDSLRKAVPKKIKKTQKSIEDILKRSKQLNDSLQMLQDNLNSLISREKNYLNNIVDATKEIDQLKSQEDLKNKEIQGLQYKVNQLTNAINAKNDSINLERQAISQLESEIKKLATQLGIDAEKQNLLLALRVLKEDLEKKGANIQESLKKVKNFENIQSELEKENSRFDAIRERYRTDSIQAKNTEDSLLQQQKILRETQKVQEAERANQEARHRYNNITAALVGLILLILLLFFYLSSRRRKKMIRELNTVNAELTKSKTEIEEKNVVLQQNIVELRKKKELEIANRKLEEANQKLDQLQKYKDKLTNMIVHDLKNPLGAVLVNSKMESSNYAIDPKTKKRLQDIHYASKRIKVYIEDMLAIQTYANSELPLHLSSYQVYRGVQTAITILRSAIKEKSLIVENNISKDYYAQYDSKYIGRVYENLLSNAIKYTDPGGKIIFSADAIPGDDQHPLGYIHFAIADSGQGIPANKFKEIFEPFMQLEAREFANTSSTGIGLTFCKMAIESHHSQIKVTSEIGVGTTFSFDLPRVEATDAPSTEEKIDETVSTEQAFSENGTIIELSKTERQALQPLVKELDKVEFYDVTTLLSILQKLEKENSPNLTQWKTAIEESIDNFNEIEYKKLKSLV